jgi:inner membrane protein
MPTVITHAVVGFGLTALLPAPEKPPWLWGVAAALAALPDLDVVGFFLGVPYGSFFGHRGFFHSLFFALLLGLAVALAAYRPLNLSWWLAWLFFYAVIASHGILDTFTNGGLGIALLSPFDVTRYFCPWQPIQVSPIGGLSAIGRWGPRVFGSEVLWVWLPLGVVVGASYLVRSFQPPS